MPNYVTITPKYQVVDLAEMLKVPELLTKERQEQEDKYNENLDKLAAIEAMADESSRWRLKNYRDSLENAANTLIGRQGTIADATAYMNQARQYYRDALPIINAYQRKQEDEKMWRQIFANDPSTRRTALPNQEAYIQNPNQDWFYFSGDKVYDKALKSAALVSKDRILAKGLQSAGRAGFVKQVNDVGYTQEEQAEYANLINRYNQDPNDAGTLAKLNDPKFRQLFEDYKGLLQENLEHNYSTEDRNWGRQRILDGQLIGMTRQSTETYHTDPLATASAKSSGKKGKGEDDDDVSLPGQYIPTDRYTDKGVVEVPASTANQTVVIDRNTGKTVNKSALKPTKVVMTPKPNYFMRDVRADLSPNLSNYEEVGSYEASAIYYNNDAKKLKEANKADDTLVDELNTTFNRNSNKSPKGTLKYSKDQINHFRSLGKYYFLKFKSFEDVTEDAKKNYFAAIRSYYLPFIDDNGKIVKWEDAPKEAKDLILKIGYSGLADIPRTRTEKTPEGILDKKTFNKLQKAGVQFYNNDDSPRTNDEIAYDAFLLTNRQWKNAALTTEAGAGEQYTNSVIYDPKGNFKLFGKHDAFTQDGKPKHITFTPESIKNGMYSDFKVEIDPIELTKSQPKKAITFTDINGKRNHIYIPYNANEKTSIATTINNHKESLAKTLLLSGTINEVQENAIKQMPDTEFVKGVLYGKLKVGNTFIPIPQFYNINSLLNSIDDSILYDFESNFIPKNSETNGKIY